MFLIVHYKNLNNEENYICHTDKCIWIFTPYALSHGCLNDYGTLLLDESMEKSMEYTPKYFGGYKPLL